MALRKTLLELRTAVRDNLDEASASFWTDAQLLRNLNRAKDRTWNEVKKLKDDYFILNRTSTSGTLTILTESYAATGFQIVATTREYTLPFDVSEVKLIEVITSGYEQVRFVHRDLASPEVRSLRELTVNQSPATIYFDLVGERTLTIAPASDTTLDLRLWYVPILDDLVSDTDTLQMPHPLYAAVEEFATARSLVQDRAAEAATWEQMGLATVQRFMGAHRRQTQDPELVSLYMADYC